ncbi:unnamed protein product [Timema podura]|uniref:Uncharacterized protein n=1 Tax=Timema podura TaxID=61482 RepID=A0ABN7NF81_TIMPD|nr:unnamed protein product [Timema podura]
MSHLVAHVLSETKFGRVDTDKNKKLLYSCHEVAQRLKKRRRKRSSILALSNVASEGAKASSLSSRIFLRSFNSATAFLTSSSGAPLVFNERTRSPFENERLVTYETHVMSQLHVQTAVCDEKGEM